MEHFVAGLTPTFQTMSILFHTKQKLLSMINLFYTKQRTKPAPPIPIPINHFQ